ncbi:MAG TPA: beta-ketoacyl-ACP synthase [Xanthobacteraceae bacterium]|jgi:3-oxoacyl-[acyl-carrier-protein] synthase II|nr:beta-ketoacyl-ACP synthase [Xanthobacteraceae bacterium]
MSDASREIWITGLGIVSCLGEGPQVHWQRLNEPVPTPELQGFAPYIVHRLAPIEFDKQIPKKGDQRQMELWQRIGTYAAGLALESAGAKGSAGLLARMDMIVAAGGGERDEALDVKILSNLPTSDDKQPFINESLMGGLRPTLFLAQLSNLLAGNISIVHGVTGSSRTFMGEETSGIEAVRIASARIAAGQSDIALVGGALNGDRKDTLLLYEFGKRLLKQPFAPVWERKPRGGGLILGSLGAFLVLESREHAQARNAKPMARLACIVSDRCIRQAGDTAKSLARLWQRIENKSVRQTLGIISGATGCEPATSEERDWLRTLGDVPVRATGTYVGHGMEPQFVMNIALATLALQHGQLFAPGDNSGVESVDKRPITQVAVTGVGHWRGEGIALVEAAQ